MNMNIWLCSNCIIKVSIVKYDH